MMMMMMLSVMTTETLKMKNEEEEEEKEEDIEVEVEKNECKNREAISAATMFSTLGSAAHIFQPFLARISLLFYYFAITSYVDCVCSVFVCTCYNATNYMIFLFVPFFFVQ